MEGGQGLRQLMLGGWGWNFEEFEGAEREEERREFLLSFLLPHVLDMLVTLQSLSDYRIKP